MMCSSSKCGVCECEDDEIPAPWKLKKTSPVQHSSPFGAEFGWVQDSNPEDWFYDEEFDEKAVYVNLLNNTESFTGFNGT